MIMGTGLSEAAHAGSRAGFAVVDIGAQSKEAFKSVRDVGLDLFRRHAVVEGRNDNHRRRCCLVANVDEVS